MAEVLTYRMLHASLLDRLNGGKTFEGRTEYVGASEIGGCPRQVCLSKLHAREIRDAKVAGVMLPGRVLENEVVQILRASFGRSLTSTGRSQLEAVAGKLRGHPDGMLAAGSLELSPEVVYLMPNGGRLMDLTLEGPGVLEIKTASADVWSDFQRNGLPLGYRDQVCSNMGMLGASWTLVIAVSRENLSNMLMFVVRLDADRYGALVQLADSIMASRDAVRGALLDAGLLATEDFPADLSSGSALLEAFEDRLSSPEERGSEWLSQVHAVEDAFLPAPVIERGWCGQCPLRSSRCSAHAKDGAVNVWPEDMQLVVDALAEERTTEGETKSAAEKAYNAATSALKADMERFGFDVARTATWEVSIREQPGRASVALDRLKEMWPEAYDACVLPGNPIRILTCTNLAEQAAKLAAKAAKKGKK